LTEIDEQLDIMDQDILSTKCINGHKFKVPKEKIAASSSGKSFVTLCPKCNKVARLRKEDVYKMFGVNPRDPVAVGQLFASLSGQTQTATSTSAIQNGAVFQPDVNTTIPRSEGLKTSALDTTEDVDDEEDEEEPEDDEEEEEEDDEDPEYTAQVETTTDISGKKTKASRFRVLADEDDEYNDEDEDYERTPIREKKPTKKARARVPVEEDEDDEDVPRVGRKSVSRPHAPLEEDEPMDPNEILKNVIEESGIDEISMAHIFDYIDLQPDGWQPSAIQGVIEMYLSPASSRKIAQRYQAELYREQKRRERQERLLSMMGNPAGNMHLNDSRGINTPPFNTPIMRGGIQNGMPFPGNRMQEQFPQRDPYGRDMYVDPMYRDSRIPYDVDPRAMAMAPPVRPQGVSPQQVKQMITEELTSQFEKLQNSLVASKREDALQNEVSQMRALMFDVIKSKSMDQGAPQQKQTDPLLASLLANQSELNKTLLMNTLESGKREDPMQKILMQELMELKKGSRASPLTNTSEELTQRIQLQKLANELELAQAEFKDKAEGRAFARDLAGQALTKIGESFATAYLESQRMAAMQAHSQSLAETQPPQAQTEPLASEMEQIDAKPEPKVDTGAQPRAPEQKQVTEAEKYHVRGVSKEDGTIAIPCPTCGLDIIAHPGDTRVVCGTCGSAFTAAGSPPEEAQPEAHNDESPKETPTTEGVFSEEDEAKKRAKVIL